jgi:Spy/CpxP family protein refolding chaperone
VTTEQDSRAAEPPASSPRFKAAFVLAAVFVLGGVAGVAVGRITSMRELRHMMEGPPGEARARFRMEAMRRHLDLNEDQVTRIRAVMSEADADREKLMATCDPELEDLRKRTDARVREILNEEQRRRFDQLHHGRMPGPWPPGRPPR